MSILTAFIASLVNAVMGLILAWVLVRYDFPGKRIVDGLIELPFALPTAVAGISLTHLTVKQGWVGAFFAKFGIDVAYTRLGIVSALIFIGIPFVVRSVQPVLEKIDLEYEEAASILGASRIRIFFQVILPEIFPSLIAGFTMAFARCIGEYGSVVFIAGNTPYKTEITPLLMDCNQKKDVEQIIAHAKAQLPNEACGLIAGSENEAEKVVEKVYYLTNRDASNEHFSLDPREQLLAVKDMRAIGLKPLGNWHSHPKSPSRPSEEDKRLAYDPKASYLILSLMEETPVLRSFHVENGEVKREEIYPLK